MEKNSLTGLADVPQSGVRFSSFGRAACDGLVDSCSPQTKPDLTTWTEAASALISNEKAAARARHVIAGKAAFKKMSALSIFKAVSTKYNDEMNIRKYFHAQMTSRATVVSHS